MKKSLAACAQTWRLGPKKKQLQPCDPGAFIKSRGGVETGWCPITRQTRAGHVFRGLATNRDPILGPHVGLQFAHFLILGPQFGIPFLDPILGPHFGTPF